MMFCSTALEDVDFVDHIFIILLLVQRGGREDTLQFESCTSIKLEIFIINLGSPFHFDQFSEWLISIDSMNETALSINYKFTPYSHYSNKHN